MRTDFSALQEDSSLRKQSAVSDYSVLAIKVYCFGEHAEFVMLFNTLLAPEQTNSPPHVRKRLQPRMKHRIKSVRKSSTDCLQISSNQVKQGLDTLCDWISGRVGILKTVCSRVRRIVRWQGWTSRACLASHVLWKNFYFLVMVFCGGYTFLKFYYKVL